MMFVLPALAVAYAALCVWLTVRIGNRREKWAKWTLVATLSLPVLYVLSFGPACWWFSKVSQLPHGNIPAVRRVSAFYQSIGWIALRGPAPVTGMVAWYAAIGLKKNESVECEIGFGERYRIIPFAKL